MKFRLPVFIVYLTTVVSQLSESRQRVINIRLDAFNTMVHRPSRARCAMSTSTTENLRSVIPRVNDGHKYLTDNLQHRSIIVDLLVDCNYNLKKI